MSVNKPGITKAVLFLSDLVQIGGLERLLLEEVKHFEQHWIETYILTYAFEEGALFGNRYRANIEIIGDNQLQRHTAFLQASRVLSLRKRIKQIQPDIIIVHSAIPISFYLASLLTPFSYYAHIHGTIFWFRKDTLKYAFIHRGVFNEIRESVPGHKEFVPIAPRLTLMERLQLEFKAIVRRMAVRKAQKIFVLSNQMKWEVNKLYGRDAVLLKGAFPRGIFTYKPRQNIKARLGLEGKQVILNINRLDPRKRVDLLLRSYQKVSKRFQDVFLVIGGIGWQEKELRKLAEKLGVQDKLRFIGYVKDEELWDYYASCDLFVHPNWADFAIAPYEALALGRKVVWSTEMETDEALVKSNRVFVAAPTVEDFAKTMETALAYEIGEAPDLSLYTWESYFDGLLAHVLDESG